MITETKYQIVAQCDPYNAKFHYRGERVLEYDALTPIKWVLFEDLTHEEAIARLWKMALQEAAEKCDILPEDNESYKDFINTVMEDFGMTRDEAEKSFPWYKGEGIYYTESREPMMLKGDRYYTYDTMTYEIQEIK